MLRWLALAVLVVAISAAAAWISFSIPAGDSLGDVPFPAPSAKERKGPPPSLVLDAVTTFDFGIMGQNATGSRDFLIGNEGPGDLVLIGTQPTCSCTVANLQPGEQAIVKPGEQYKVTIRWETRQNQGRYEKYARIETNDPQRPQVMFTVQGEVEPDLVTLPPDGNIDLRQLANDQPHRYEAVIASPSRPETVITGLTTSRPELLKVSHEPLDEEEAARLKLKGGHKILIEVQPTADLGPFLEEVVVTTDHPKQAEARFSVGGTVVGPISLVPSSVRMSDVLSNRGAETAVIVWVRGRTETEFTVAKAPDALNVAIVPVDDRGRTKSGDAAGRAYRMTVSVKSGTPPGVIDTPIVLETDHPKAAEIVVPVEIRVLGEG